MIDLRRAKRIAIIGAGLAGWFAALAFRRIFSPAVEVLVLENPEAAIAGVGESSLQNLVSTLGRNGIDVDEFMRESGAVYKLGSAFEGWRTGAKGDEYYHLFPMPGEQVQELELTAFGVMPLLAARVSAGVDLHGFFPGFTLIAGNASQLEAKAVLVTRRSGIAPSFQFDSHKAGAYLKNVALKRGIIHRAAAVRKLAITPGGVTSALQMDGEEIPVDFVVDASGLSRLGIGAGYGEKWRSFREFLIADRAMFFRMPHPRPAPDLLTRHIAMDCGWMWQIATQEDVAAGYIFSSGHADQETAAAEVEKRLGHPVEPWKLIEFEAGHFERTWRNNVIAFGSASGFVEPMEGAISGQLFESLRNFERILVEGRGVLSGGTVEAFNLASHQSWTGIADYLRMHYENVRGDTPFWRDAGKLPMQETLRDLRRVFSQRLPRMIDFEPYAGNGWMPIFHMVDWLMAAAPLGVVSQGAATAELANLPEEFRQRVAPYIAQLQQNAGAAGGSDGILNQPLGSNQRLG